MYVWVREFVSRKKEQKTKKIYTKMSAAGVKIATTTTANALAAAVLDDGDVSSNTANAIKEHAVFATNHSGESSFRTLSSSSEAQSSSSNCELNQKVPFEDSGQNVRLVAEQQNQNENSQTETFVTELNEYASNNIRRENGENLAVAQISPGLSLLQQTAAASSPPPHSYRHSRAYRHFKNPPQPHMCIRTTTEAGEELFINVLSWTRIVIPQEPSDPIPLYGGMRVPPGSPRSPPIVFAVMANPEVLKDSGRHSKDPEERRAMVELMCDFVEAMNPGVKLVRNAVILKDRDISGELKDVWNAVQAQRDREREEQLLLQRQQHQQHFHSLSNASTNGSLITTITSPSNTDIVTTTAQQMSSKSFYRGNADDSMFTKVDGGTPPTCRKILHEVQNDNNASNINVERDFDMTRTNSDQLPLGILAEHLDNKMLIVASEKNEEDCDAKQQNNQYALTNNALSNGNNSNETAEMERRCKMNLNNQLNSVNCNKDTKKQHSALVNGSAENCNETEVMNVSEVASASSAPAQNPPTINAPLPATQQAPTKKEKLGGFLPNGCIFPRFTKNNKHKDKEKDKDKESKTRDREKNVLLSALKKSKEKKSNVAVAVAATAATIANNQDEKNTSPNSNTTTAANCSQANNKQQKNCLQQLESGVQKLEITHHYNQTHNAGNIINNVNNSAVTVANNTSATNKNTANTTSNTSGGVSVH